MPTVRPWREEDRDALVPLVLDLMREQQIGGSLVVPSEENAALVVGEGVRAAASGDPCMVATDRRPFGLCVWMGRPSPLAFARRVCHALGMYVRPERRLQGWSQRIYAAAIARAREAGYDVVEGLAVREGGYKAALRTGALPAGVVLRFEL